MYRSSWCEIDLSNLRTNIAALRKNAAPKALLVIKANAYGHGILGIAKEAQACGIDMLGAATIGEAETIQGAGVTTPILIMCAMDSTEIDYCVANDVHFMAWNKDHFRQAAESAVKYKKQPKIHLEIDTGMCRSGIVPENLEQLFDKLDTADLANIVGVMTHLHSADLEDTKSSIGQLTRFKTIFDLIENAGISPIFHAANSPGTMRIPEAHFDMVRLGVAAYGIAPSEYSPLQETMEPVLSWKANITNIGTIEPGNGVGYAWRYIADKQETLGTLGVGYADGYRRAPMGVNTILVGNSEAPVVGSVFMDQCCFKIPESMTCNVGDTVTLLGSQGDLSITSDDIAEKWMTNNYDVVASIRNRVPRRYINGLSSLED